MRTSRMFVLCAAAAILVAGVAAEGDVDAAAETEEPPKTEEVRRKGGDLTSCGQSIG